MDIILHVGAAKCGSSSLQTILSNAPVIRSHGGRRYEYVSISPAGKLIRQELLTRAARKSPHGYCDGLELQRALSNPSFARKVAAAIEDLRQDNIVPILSLESWLTDPETFAKSDFLRRFSLSAKVFIFVRPQVGWLNSAWWQWGAFSDQPFACWLDSKRDVVRWADFIERWRAVPGVGSMEIFTIAMDVVKTFYEALDAAPPRKKRKNSSLDAEALRFLQRHPDLRPEHGSEVDFALERWLEPGATTTPWVIPRNTIAALIDHYRANNEALCSLVPPRVASIMRANRRWWEASSYDHLTPVSPDPIAPAPEEAENLARRAVEAILRLDDRVRALEAEAAGDVLSFGELRQRLVPRHLRKSISINGLRRLISPGGAGGR
jgi:hypothetical protein